LNFGLPHIFPVGRFDRVGLGLYVRDEG
jgi:hypothetical protein